MNLQDIQKPVEKLLENTNSIILEKVKSNLKSLDKIEKLTPISKGKKIRSTLLFLLAGMVDLKSSILSEIAASIELFHLSSLIHDDIIDNSQKRRGEKTLNINLGNFRSVLWGDFIFINSFSSIHSLGNPELMKIVLKAAIRMVEGQLIEIENAYNFGIQLETYYDIIQRKTSSLFAAVCQMVSVLNKEPYEIREKYYRFGLDFGTIFQIVDDMLDIFSIKSGKDRFKDLEEGKITLPFILLLDESKSDITENFLNCNHQKLLEFCSEYKIKEKCLEKISFFYERCHRFLEPFPDSRYKESLLNLLPFIKYREY
jgi:octaprenyl-diphosphate synthase